MTQPLTHLGIFLDALIQRDEVDARTMADRIGIDPAVLSRLITGKRRTCNEKTLGLLVRNCSQKRADQVACMAAWLEDQVLAEFRAEIAISLQA